MTFKYMCNISVFFEHKNDPVPKSPMWKCKKCEHVDYFRSKLLLATKLLLLFESFRGHLTLMLGIAALQHQFFFSLENILPKG